MSKPLRRKCINKKIYYSTFDIDLWVKDMQNITQCPLNHVTSAPAKFENAASNGFNPFRRRCNKNKLHYLTLNVTFR